VKESLCVFVCVSVCERVSVCARVNVFCVCVDYHHEPNGSVLPSSAQTLAICNANYSELSSPAGAPSAAADPARML